MAAFGLALIVGLLWTGLSGNQSLPTMPKTPIGKVGQQDITLESVSFYVNRLPEVLANQGIIPSGPREPKDEAMLQGMALQSAVTDAAAFEMARQAGIDLDDDTVRTYLDKMAEAQGDQMVAQARQFFPNATEADFANQFKSLYGMSASEYKDRLKKDFQDRLQNPEEADSLRAQAANFALLDKKLANIPINDDAVRKSYDSWIVKRIFVDAFKDSPGNPDYERALKRMEAAKRAIDAGMDFDAAIDRYSDDPVPAGKKKKSETEPATYVRMDLQYNPGGRLPMGMDALLELKAGDVSEIVKAEPGPILYKVVRVGSTLPQDWEKTKSGRQTLLQQAAAQQELTNSLRDLLSGDSVTFTSDGFKAMYAWRRAGADSEDRYSKAKVVEQLRAAFDLAKQAVSDAEGIGGSSAAFAQYGSFLDLTAILTGAEKAELEKQRIEVLAQVSEYASTPTIHTELAKLRLEAKDAVGAVEDLAVAASGLFIYDKASLDRYEELIALRAKAVDLGATEEGLEAVDSAFETYKTEAFQVLKDSAENGLDFSADGVVKSTELESSVARVLKLGFIDKTQAGEVGKAIANWRAEKKKLDDEAEEQRKKDEAEAKAEQERLNAEEKNKKAAGGDKKPAEGTFGVPGATGTQPPTGGASGKSGG